MTRRISLIIAAAGALLVLASPAAADTWGADRNDAIVRVSPDLGDRVDAARRADLARILDARERSQAATRVKTTPPTSEPVRDDRFRLDPSQVPQPVAATTAGNELEWQQVGIGFAFGALFVVALLLVLRMPRHRLPAH